jgi:thioredoxin-like negative regulator of GroEL
MFSIIVQFHGEIESLKEQVSLLRAKIFGRRTKKFDLEQLMLGQSFLPGLESEDLVAVTEPEKKWADKEKDEYGKRHHLIQIESLARQIKDAKLFEKTRIASWGKLSTAALIDIARVYLESGDVETAHSWLKKIPEGETYQTYERDKLLEEIHQKQGDSEKLIGLLYQKFRACHFTDTLQALLEVIGRDKRDEVVADEVAQILKTDRLRESDAEFLIAIRENR